MNAVNVGYGKDIDARVVADMNTSEKRAEEGIVRKQLYAGTIDDLVVVGVWCWSKACIDDGKRDGDAELGGEEGVRLVEEHEMSGFTEVLLVFTQLPWPHVRLPVLPSLVRSTPRPPSSTPTMAASSALPTSVAIFLSSTTLPASTTQSPLFTQATLVSLVCLVFDFTVPLTPHRC